MAHSITAAMKLYEQCRYAEAAEAFAPLAGTDSDGVIANFRRAECLSRLGRHDEAIEAARAAVEADPEHPPASLWYAQALAEAGRYQEAADVPVPGLLDGEPELLSAGFRAVAAIAAGDRADAVATVCAVAACAHPPIWSLALRAAESNRLAAEPRWPDVATMFRVSEALDEADAKGKRLHPNVEPPRNTRGLELLRSQAETFVAFGSWSRIAGAVRPYLTPLEDDDETRFENLLLDGKNAAARELVFGWAEKYGDEKAAGEVAVGCARTAQLDGEARRPAEFAGAEEAASTLGLFVDWLDLCAALIEGDDPAARALSDRICAAGFVGATPEFVLLRWVLPDSAM
jgi:hypothetical protein